MVQLQGLGVGLEGIEHAVARAARPAVNAVRTRVGCETVFVPIEREARATDPAGVSAHEGAHGGRSGDHVGQPVVPEGHVVQRAGAVGHHDLQHLGTEIGDGHHHAARIAQEEEGGGPAVHFTLKARRVEQMGESG